MRKFRGVRYSLAILMVVNFIAVMLNSIIYLQATNYIIAQRQASLLVERLERIPFAPSTTFWLSVFICWNCLDLHESLPVSNESMVHF